jgi:hypothetical protein
LQIADSETHMMSPYRFRRALIDEIKELSATQRAALAQECRQALTVADEPQPVTKWRWHFNLIDKAFLVWAAGFVGLILFTPRPGGVAWALQSEHIGEFSQMFFALVAMPWAILRLLGRLGRGY